MMSYWLGMNLVMLVLMLGSSEILGRFLAKTSGAGAGVLKNIQELRNWPYFAASAKKSLERMDRMGSYLTYHPVLGWTIAPSHSDDETGLYHSSVKGLRSPRAGMSFADARARHSTISERPASIRIALVGDSFTFGHEVRCEESWGHVLEAFLQPDTQVLNFGVPAYGLDQAMLRYEQDIRPWKPQVVVIGIISQMVGRITNIYPFLKGPSFDFPFIRPQLVVKNNSPMWLYNPVPHPDQIFASQAINELPYIHLDEYYRPLQWERGGWWYLFERSYLFRLANSLWTSGVERDNDRTTRHALEMGRFLIHHFVRKIREDGAVPIVVYFPEKHELFEPSGLQLHKPDAVRILHDAGIEYVDPSDCLLRVDPATAFMKGRHYSPQANAEVAHCLQPEVLRIVSGLRDKA
jgi:hypothetical protein